MDKHFPVFQNNFMTTITSKQLIRIKSVFSDKDPENNYHVLTNQTSDLAMVNEVYKPSYDQIYKSIKPYYGSFVDIITGKIVLNSIGSFKNCIYSDQYEFMCCDKDDYVPNMISSPLDNMILFPHFDGMCFVRMWRHKGKNMFSINNKADAKYSKTGNAKTYTEIFASLGLPSHTEIFGEASDSNGLAHVFVAYSPCLQVGKMFNKPDYLGSGKLFYFGAITPIEFITAEEMLSRSDDSSWISKNVVTDLYSHVSKPEDIKYLNHGGINITTIADAIIDGEKRSDDRFPVFLYPRITLDEAKILLEGQEEGKQNLLNSSTAVLVMIKQPSEPIEFVRVISKSKSYQEFILGYDQFNIIRRITYFHMLASDLVKLIQNKEIDLKPWNTDDIFFTYCLQDTERMASIGLCNNIYYINIFNLSEKIINDIFSKSIPVSNKIEILINHSHSIYSQCINDEYFFNNVSIELKSMKLNYNIVSDFFVKSVIESNPNELDKLLIQNTNNERGKRDINSVRYNTMVNTIIKLYQIWSKEGNDPGTSINELVYHTTYDIIRSCAKIIM